MVHIEKTQEILPVLSARVAYANIKKLNDIKASSSRKKTSVKEKQMSFKKKQLKKISLESSKPKQMSVEHNNNFKKQGKKFKKESLDSTASLEDHKIKSGLPHLKKSKKIKKVTSSPVKILKTNNSSQLNCNSLLQKDKAPDLVCGKTYIKKSAKKRDLEDSLPNLVNLKVSKSDKTYENGDSMEKSANIVTSQPLDSRELGASKFQWIISPIPLEKFFKQYWEKKALFVQRKDKNYYKGLFSTQAINNILITRNVQFTKNVDLASYKDGKRETHNPEGRALAPVVWDHFNNGCSVRLLNPQTFHKPVWNLLATLQEYFQSFCGANIYLTPPGTQGFAPHWDDIEAFVIQLEGKKRWRVYSPRTEDKTLPRESSKNFGPEDNLGKPVLDVILEAGDLLYFPRGFIHQGEALEDTHSLHLTFSTYQKTAWVDFLEKLVPAALETAATEDVEFRKGLPLGYGYAGGVAFSDNKSVVKEQFTKKVHELVDKMMKSAPVDAAIDQMVKGFIHDSLPPVIDEEESACSVYGGGEMWDHTLKRVVNRVELAPDTAIRLLRKGCVRLVIEENSIRLFHSVENSREYHAEEPKYIELDSEMAPALETIIHSYPEYLKVEDLPLESLADKLTLAMGLWEKGLITTYEPLSNDFED